MWSSTWRALAYSELQVQFNLNCSLRQTPKEQGSLSSITLHLSNAGQQLEFRFSPYTGKWQQVPQL